MADAEQNLDLSINVDIGGVKEKIDAVTSKIKEFGSEVGGSADEATEKMNPLSDSLDESKEAAEGASRSFEKMTGAGLALLFAGRFLDQTFGGLARSMFDMFGITDMFSGALKTVLLPAFKAVTPIIINLINKFMNMGKTSKLIIGSIVLIGAVLAPVIAVLGQFIAGFTALSGILSGSVVVAIGAVIGIVAAFASAFIAAFKLVKKFGAAVGAIIVIIGALVAAIASSPVLIAAAIGAILGAIFAMRDDIVSAVKKIIDWFVKLPGRLTDMASDLLDAGLELGGKILDGLVNGIKGAGDAILNAIDAITPGLPVKKIVDVAGGAIDSITSANDFVLSDGKLVRTHPNDTIMATKDPSSLGQGGEGGGDTVIVKDPTVRDDRDVDKIADEVEKRLDRQTRGRSGIR